MKRLPQKQRNDLICKLVSSMRQNDSWAGETHIQKTVLFVQELLGIPLGYRFILYKYGPFSFDLRNELASMRARLMLDVEPRIEYGPSFKLGIHGKRAAYRIKEFNEPVRFIAKELARYNVQELERLSTTFYVETKEHHNSKLEIANRVTELKPHIPLERAVRAVEQVNELRQAASKLGWSHRQ